MEIIITSPQLLQVLNRVLFPWESGIRNSFLLIYVKRFFNQLFLQDILDGLLSSFITLLTNLATSTLNTTIGNSRSNVFHLSQLFLKLHFSLIFLLRSQFFLISTLVFPENFNWILMMFVIGQNVSDIIHVCMTDG